MKPLPRFAGPAIFVIAMSTLVLEVTLTRIFSVMTYYHFTYVIIGLALLGFGAAGSILSVHRRFAGDRVDPALLADCAWGFGLSLMICFAWITKTSFEPLAVYEHGDFSQLFALLVLLLLASVPFVFAGLCIGYLISKSGEQINQIYFFDLSGAAFGSLAALFAINWLGAPSTIFVVALAACGVASLLSSRVGGRIRWRYPLTAAAALALAVLSFLDPGAVPVPFPRSKGVDIYRTVHRWHVIARVDVGPPRLGYPSFGGRLSERYAAPRPSLNYRRVTQDGFAPTGILDLRGRDPRDLEILGYYLQASPYAIHPGGRVLVIGPGGGVDVAIALHYGSPRVTAVDVNPWTIDFVRDRYDEFAGGLYRRPDVEVIVAEGRHYLTRTDEKFDVIQLSGVDTFSALASGAYALTESYLYTREAMTDLLDRLEPGGVLSFSRWLFSPPRESLRLALTARVALERRGVPDPARHIVVIAGYRAGESPWADTMIKLEPFGVEEIAALRAWAERLGFDVIYDPLLPYAPGGAYDALEPAPEFDPVLDARLFDEALRAPPDRFGEVLDAYPYDIAPVVDDSPFFFNFYRLGSLLRPFDAGLGGMRVLRFPLGLAVMIACLLQALVFGALFILWPLRGRVASLAGSPGTTGVLVYFACIGLAFIAIEIMVLQLLTVFLGGPTYSMSVTLFSLLLFSGLGSYLSRGLTRRDLHASGAAILGCVVVVVPLTGWFLSAVVPSLMGLSHLLRCVVAVAALLPLGLLLGMPFPTGIRMAERLDPRLVPWAWGVNACATVVGSIGSIAVAMFVGFSAVLWASAAFYLAALLMIRLVLRRAEPVADPVR